MNITYKARFELQNELQNNSLIILCVCIFRDLSKNSLKYSIYLELCKLLRAALVKDKEENPESNNKCTPRVSIRS